MTLVHKKSRAEHPPRAGFDLGRDPWNAVQRVWAGRASRDDDTETAFVAVACGRGDEFGRLVSTTTLRVTAGIASVATILPSQQLRDGTITVSSITV